MSRRSPVPGLSRPVVVVLVAALVLGACGGRGSTPEEAVPEPSRAPNQDLRVAVGPDPFLPGTPPNPNLGLVTNGPNPGIFETLTQLTDTFGLAPGLALRWEAPRPEQWRFFLRPDVRFHNDAPLDAQAVVDWLDTVGRRQNRPRGLDPGVAKAAGPTTVELNLTAPNTRLAEQLANPNLGVVAPGTQALDGAGPATTPTGTGAFRFETYQKDVQLVVRAFEGYWGGKPELRSITFRFGPERDAGRLLATRQVELAGQVPYSYLPKVSGRTDQVKGSRPGRAEYLVLNRGGIEPYTILKNDNVRRAVALAVERKAVQKAAWAEDGDDNGTIVPPAVLADAADRVRTPSQNQQEAGRLLDQAGWGPGANGVRSKDGRPLALTLILARPGEQEGAAEALKGQLAQVGIGLQVVDPAPESPFVRVNNATFDLYMASQPQDDANPCSLCRFFTVRPGGQLAFATAAGGNPRVDELYERVFASPSVDTARRLAADIMQIVVAEDHTAVPLATLRQEWLVSPRVRGFEPSPLGGAQRWNGVYLTV